MWPNLRNLRAKALRPWQNWLLHRKGEDGVHVGFDYQKKVTLQDRCFAGARRGAAIVEEMLVDRSKDMKVFVSWSKPVVQTGNVFFSSVAALPLTSDAVKMTPPPLSSSGTAFYGTAIDRAAMLMSTKRRALKSDDGLYFPVGNTFGVDVTGGCDLKTGKGLNILFSACGDIRNLLKTMSEVKGRCSGRVNVRAVLIDKSISILARDILLLRLIETGTSAEDVVAIWGSHALSSAQRKLLDNTCRSLAVGEWPRWLRLPVSLGEGSGPDTATQLRHVFNAWASCSISLEEILTLFSASMGENVMLCLMTEKKRCSLSIAALGSLAQSARKKGEVVDYLCSGSFDEKNATQPNPTMLEAPDMQNSAHWTTSIFLAIKLPTPKSRPRSLSSFLTSTVAQQMEALSKTLNDSTLVVDIVLGDIIHILLSPWPTFRPLPPISPHLSSPLTEETGGRERGVFRGSSALPVSTLRSQDDAAGDDEMPLFDFVDCSNVMDYVSLPNLLQAMSVVLRRERNSRIRIQSISWLAIEEADKSGASAPRVRRFVEKAIGMSLAAYKRLLGLQLITSSICMDPNDVASMEWKWSPSFLSPKGQAAAYIRERKYLSEIVKAAEIHCCPVRPDVVGWNWSSALTLVHLLLLSVPDEAESLVKHLSEVSQNARLHKWELMLQVWIHSQRFQRPSSLILASYTADTDCHLLAAASKFAYVLIFSKTPLIGGCRPESALILQIMDSFAFDNETYQVHFFLSTNIRDEIIKGSYFVTLSACGTNSVCAMSVSTPVSELTVESVPVDLGTWNLGRKRA